MRNTYRSLLAWLRARPRGAAGLVLLAVLAGCEASDTGPCYCGRVADAVTGAPINGAFVTEGNSVVRTDYLGRFRLPRTALKAGVRAFGYRRADIPAREVREDTPILLQRFAPKGLYLSFYGVSHKRLRRDALRLIAHTELNALVIDVKGDRGYVAFRSAVPLARVAGAQKIITIKDLPAMVRALHAKGIYLIARIVVFKDDRLGRARPDMAVKTAQGRVWVDREGLAWTNPFDKDVWNYNIDIAEEAARAGFDEIQFDYVRFPDRYGLVYGKPLTLANRVAAITGFLLEARTRLAPWNVFVAADVFGYVAWNRGDTYIGQQIESLARVTDYLSPMLYPSGFQFGIPGIRNPMKHPREVVLRSLEMAQKRTRLPAVRFRPWLQAFPDYAFGRKLGAAQIRAQIDAAEAFGSDGWMLWNPRNVYSARGLNPRR